MKNLPQRGFTLIELIIVLAVMGSVFGFGIVMGMHSLARSSVIEERDLFVSILLSGARSHALANVGETSHGIYIDSAQHEYVLFRGTVYNPSASTNEHIPFSNKRLSITNSSGDSSIIFEALSGNVREGAGTVTISGNDAVQELTISDIGQINW